MVSTKDRPGLRWYTKTTQPQGHRQELLEERLSKAVGEQISKNWLATFLPMLGIGIPFWWSWVNQPSGFIRLVLATTFLALCVSWVSIRRLRSVNQALRDENEILTKRGINIQNDGHDIIDLARNLIAENTSQLNEIRGRKVKGTGNEGTAFMANQYRYFKRDLESLCKETVLRLQTLMEDEQISLAVRIGIPESENASTVEYHTVCAAGRLNFQKREATTESVKSNEGVHKTVLEFRGEGVLHYHDLEQAAADGTFKKTHNYIEYDEINQMVVIPISFRNGAEYRLLGTLHVTTPREEIRVCNHVSFLCGLADVLAMFLISRYHAVRDTAIFLDVFQESGDAAADLTNFLNLALAPLKKRQRPKITVVGSAAS